jgi:hypothetical protein
MKILWAMLATVVLVGCGEPVYYSTPVYPPGYYHGIYYRTYPVIERREYYHHEEHHEGYRGERGPGRRR